MVRSMLWGWLKDDWLSFSIKFAPHFIAARSAGRRISPQASEADDPIPSALLPPLLSLLLIVPCPSSLHQSLTNVPLVPAYLLLVIGGLDD